MRTYLLLPMLALAAAAHAQPKPAAPPKMDPVAAAGTMLANNNAVEDTKNWCAKAQPATNAKVSGAYDKWKQRYAPQIAQALQIGQMRASAQQRQDFDGQQKQLTDDQHRKLNAMPPAEQAKWCTDAPQRFESPELNQAADKQVMDALASAGGAPSSPAAKGTPAAPTGAAAAPAVGAATAAAEPAVTGKRPNNPAKAHMDARKCLDKDNDAKVRACAEKYR